MTVNNQPQEDKGQGNENDGEEAGEGNGKQNDSAVAFIEALVHCKYVLHMLALINSLIISYFPI